MKPLFAQNWPNQLVTATRTFSSARPLICADSPRCSKRLWRFFFLLLPLACAHIVLVLGATWCSAFVINVQPSPARLACMIRRGGVNPLVPRLAFLTPHVSWTCARRFDGGASEFQGASWGQLKRRAKGGRPCDGMWSGVLVRMKLCPLSYSISLTCQPRLWRRHRETNSLDSRLCDRGSKL